MSTCMIRDDDETTAVADLTRRMDIQDAAIISLRSMLMDLSMVKMAKNATAMIKDSENLSSEQEAAVESMVPEYTLTGLKFINPCCIVGHAAMGRNKYGLKITRKLLTLSKYQQPAEVELAMVDKSIRNVLFS